MFNWQNGFLGKLTGQQAQGNQQYGQQAQYGQQYGQQMPQAGAMRVTKGAVYQMVQEYCYSQTGVMVSKLEKIDECPSSVRHACTNGGIQFLPQYYLTIPSANGNIIVYFYFCNCCGKLFVFDEFM